MRVRQHVNPLKSEFFTIPVERLALPPGAPVEVELGCAEAWFLMERAEAEPDRHYVGVEIRRPLVEPANEEARRRGLPQVRIVFANMSVDLPRLFAPGSVARFFLNFPDPWFKTQQHKRRVITPALAAELHALLVGGGEIYVNTDIWELALDAMATFEAGPLQNLLAPWSFLRESRFAARSRRERQCADEGVRVWRLGYVKRPPAPSSRAP